MAEPEVAPFSPARKQAIEFVNQGITATAGANGIAPNAQIGYQLISSAVDVDPTFAHGWFAMGNANGDLKLKEASVACYRRALQLPEGKEIGDLTADVRAKALCNMGHTLFHLGKHEEAMKCTMASLAMDNTMAFTWCNKSLIHSVRGQDVEALAAAQRAHQLDPANPTVGVALAFALLHKKLYADGLMHFEARFPYKLTQFMNYPYPKWQGEKDADLFLVSDQGIGDSIDFLRFVPAALKRCRKIYLGTQPELMRVLHAMFGKYENVHLMALPQPFPPATHWAALMSLPTAMGLLGGDIEWAEMPSFDVPKHNPEWKVPGKKLHVGVAWAGARGNDVDCWRSCQVENFLELCRVPNVQFYSLQVGERGQEMHNAGAATLIKDITPYIRDVMDTLAIAKNLDLIVTVDTGLGHMAGMIDVPTLIPVSFNGCCWRFSRHGDKSLWYPKHKLFRQAEDCDWKPVFEAIGAELDKLANGGSHAEKAD